MSKNLMCRALTLWAFVWCSAIDYAQGQNELVPIRDLTNKWLTVDREGSQYIPYIKGSSLNYPVIGLLLDDDLGDGLTLQLCIQAGTSVFINNNIIDRTSNAGCLYYDVDSLMTEYSGESLFISFFRENLEPGSINTHLMTRQLAHARQGHDPSTLQIKVRSQDHFSDFFVITILVILAFYAFLINQHPKGHKDFFNVSKAFSLTLKEEKVLTQRNMAPVNTQFLWLYSMVISLVIVLFWKVFGGVPELFSFVSFESLRSTFYSWLVLSLISVTVVGLKYLLIKILCSLLNLSRIAQIHFFDFMRISLIFVSVILITSAILYLSFLDHLMPLTVVLYIFLGLLCVRIVILLFKLIGDTSFRKIHLISYLCTTEILPLLIGIRIFF